MYTYIYTRAPKGLGRLVPRVNVDARPTWVRIPPMYKYLYLYACIDIKMGIFRYRYKHLSIHECICIYTKAQHSP